ncbi:hypothetical protein Syun_022729 [Stephania yunnanensis]|uniref:Uncharacterized protein n=1 Tax=Stephania yunnanensis TaxID=152371 RepID=A0AAP0FJY0_9MAGN
MLPWENVQGLENQEVYHMPSISSILMLIQMNQHRCKESGLLSINPKDGFAVVDKDLDVRTLLEHYWIAETEPTAAQWISALEKHNYYFFTWDMVMELYGAVFEEGKEGRRTITAFVRKAQICFSLEDVMETKCVICYGVPTVLEAKEKKSGRGRRRKRRED